MVVNALGMEDPGPLFFTVCMEPFERGWRDPMNTHYIRSTWRIIPFSQWFVTMVGKSPNWGCSPSKQPKWLVNGGYELLTNWDDPPSIWGWLRLPSQGALPTIFPYDSWCHGFRMAIFCTDLLSFKASLVRDKKTQRPRGMAFVSLVPREVWQGFFSPPRVILEKVWWGDSLVWEVDEVVPPKKWNPKALRLQL